MCGHYITTTSTLYDYFIEYNRPTSPTIILKIDQITVFYRHNSLMITRSNFFLELLPFIFFYFFFILFFQLRYFFFLSLVLTQFTDSRYIFNLPMFDIQTFLSSSSCGLCWCVIFFHCGIKQAKKIWHQEYTRRNSKQFILRSWTKR